MNGKGWKQTNKIIKTEYKVQNCLILTWNIQYIFFEKSLLATSMFSAFQQSLLNTDMLETAFKENVMLLQQCRKQPCCQHFRPGHRCGGL